MDCCVPRTLSRRESSGFHSTWRAWLARNILMPLLWNVHMSIGSRPVCYILCVPCVYFVWRCHVERAWVGASKAEVNGAYHWLRSSHCWKELINMGLSLMLPKFKLVTSPKPLKLFQALWLSKWATWRKKKHPKTMKNFFIFMASSQRAARYFFKTHTLCMFLLFTLGKGVWGGEWAACNNILFTFLVVIFVMVSDVWDFFFFFFPFLPSRLHHIGMLVSDSSVDGMP